MLEARNSAKAISCAVWENHVWEKLWRGRGVEGSEFCRLLFWERRRGSEDLYSMGYCGTGEVVLECTVLQRICLMIGIYNWCLTI